MKIQPLSGSYLSGAEGATYLYTKSKTNLDNIHIFCFLFFFERFDIVCKVQRECTGYEQTSRSPPPWVHLVEEHCSWFRTTASARNGFKGTIVFQGGFFSDFYTNRSSHTALNTLFSKLHRFKRRVFRCNYLHYRSVRSTYNFCAGTGR